MNKKNRREKKTHTQNNKINRKLDQSKKMILLPNYRLKKIYQFLKQLFTGEKKAEKPATEPRMSQPETRPTPPRKPQQTKHKKKKWALKDFQVDPKDGETRFHDLDLPLSVMHAVADLKFQYCLPPYLWHQRW